ncbi:MAG: FtsX-like permease family protein, partial [Bacteroidota bacterium]
AFILSGYKPAAVLSGSSGRTAGGSGSIMRKSLVVVQFAVSVVLIAGTIIIFQQLMHLQKTKLGVNIDQTVVVNAPMVFDSTYQAKYTSFKKEVMRIAGVQQITGSTDVPGQQVGWTAAIRMWGGDDDSYEGLQAIAMDADFGEQYGLEAVAGRLLSPKMLSDSAACVLNERGVERLRIESPKAAIGQEIDFWGDRLTIVGVVKNFHQRSPKMEFEPLVLRLSDPSSPPAYFSIRTTMDESKEVLAGLRGLWGRMFPGNPFEYFFLDDHFAKQYEADQRLGSLIALFAGLAIFVSCLGLFALAAFVAERRTKEIGIRKVLGASVESLVALLSKEFIVLVGIAIIIAIPVGWLLMNNWLNNFVIRINLQWWVFVLAGGLAIVIAFITMSFQSIKAALSNPIESLRNE